MTALLGIALAAIMTTLLVSLAVKRRRRGHGRATAIILCGGAVPVALGLLSAIDHLSTILHPPAGLPDMISRSGLLLLLAIAVSPLTLSTAVAVLWRRR